jgi:hypothetical protein
MLAQYLRQLAKNGQHGHVRTPATIYVGASYCSFYWDNHGVVPDHATWERVAALGQRYRSFVAYCRETLPEWREVDRIYYADNSTVAIEEDKDGNRRNRMLVAPHGDVCF